MNPIGKFCTGCREFKPLNEFGTNKVGILGRTPKCIICLRKVALASRNKHIDLYRKKRKEYYYANRDEEIRKSKEWNIKNAERVVLVRKKRNSDPNFKKRKNKLRRDRMKIDPSYKMESYLRCRMYQAMRGQNAKKNKRYVEYIGCTVAELMAHLEKQFTPLMNWDNYGSYWHVDHIEPCAKFNLADEKDILTCFHYTNLQPLEADKNRSKRDKNMKEFLGIDSFLAGE